MIVRRLTLPPPLLLLVLLLLLPLLLTLSSERFDPPLSAASVGMVALFKLVAVGLDADPEPTVAVDGVPPDIVAGRTFPGR